MTGLLVYKAEGSEEQRETIKISDPDQIYVRWSKGSKDIRVQFYLQKISTKNPIQFRS